MKDGIPEEPHECPSIHVAGQGHKLVYCHHPTIVNSMKSQFQECTWIRACRACPWGFKVMI